MTEIEFSYIQDFEQDDHLWSIYTEEFSAQKGIKVQLKPMTWDTAWGELFSYTSLTKGPHVSHIGNTWVSSLARMNVLRPFKHDEVAAVGGAWDFIAPNWESGVLFGDRRVWAIPWTAWIYVICYRRDLFEKVGINPVGAFGTVSATTETVKRLAASSLEIPWLNPQLPVSYRDLMHIAASWIWATGGDFINRQGSSVVFNSQQAVDGLQSWLEIYRAVPPAYRKFTQEENLRLFREGHAAAAMVNIRGANELVNMQDNSTVRENLEVAAITEVPWIGGGSFVIWDHVQDNVQTEQAAVQLVEFLASKEINLRYQRETDCLPSRIDALKEIYPEGNPAREAVMEAASAGRGYYSIPIWRRIEHQLSEEIGTVVNEVVENPKADPVAVLHAHLDPLAQRINLALGG